jgi:heme oxygenase
MQIPTRRFRLRELTAEAHASLDAMIGDFDSVESYNRYLVGMHGFRSAVESALARAEWPAIFGNWRPDFIASYAADDLMDLGLKPEPVRHEFEIAPDASSLFGIAYVLEGSSLGARVLYKRALALGMTPNHGARHLALQAATIDNWGALLEILEAAEPFDMAAAAKASNETFHIAERAFMSTADVC